MGVLVLMRPFISRNEVFYTAYALLPKHEQNFIFKDTTMGPMIPKEIKILNIYWLRFLTDDQEVAGSTPPSAATFFCED